MGREDRVKMLRRLNNSQITKDEVKRAVKEMKAGKTAVFNGCAVECLKNDDTNVMSG